MLIKKTIKKTIKKIFKIDGLILPDYVNPFDLKDLPLCYYKSFGDENPDKFFYVIWRDGWGSGFFSNVSHVLCHIKLADNAKMIPVIDFQNFKTLYNEEKEINQTKNSWEYYFKTISPFNLKDIYESKNVFFCSGNYPTTTGLSYSITKIENLYEDIFKKFISPQDHVIKRLNDFASYFNNRILGVHFRGQEMKTTARHSFPPTKKQMIKYTDEIIEKFDIEKIFISTEEQSYLDLFLRRYGKRILYNKNAFRTYNVNAFSINPRKNHRYLLGLDVMLDSYLLSKCNGLLCGDSGVSEYAQFVNNNKYEFVYFISNGVNSDNRLIAKILYGIKKKLPSRFGGFYDIVLDRTP